MRLLVAVIDLLPLSWAVAGARRLADLAYALDRRRRRVAIDNLKRSGLAGSEREAARLARASARHFATVLVETLRAPRILADEEAVVFRIPEAVESLLDDPDRGLLIATGHFGNWEIGGQAFARFKPLTAAARRVSNPRVDSFLRRRKPAERFRLVDEWFGSPTRYTETLGRGEALALLIDLDARGEGIQLEFFGRNAATHVTAAMLHLVTKAPLVFASCARLAPGRFEVTFSEPIRHAPTGDREADIRAVLGRLHAELERVIRGAPEQYLWAHSRWKHGDWSPPEGFVPVRGRLGSRIA